MILPIAAIYWLFLWLTAPPGSNSGIKANYPDLQNIEVVRSRFLENLSGLSEDSRGLVAGLAIGERNLISVELDQAMRDLSLTHLIAVSGANLAIVLGSIYFLTAWMGLSRNLRFATALIVMCLYVLLVGPESSVIRAATMALFVMLGLWTGRGSNPIFALASAVFVLLLIDPGLATDVGFGLSAFATAGLVVLTPVIYQRLEGRMSKVLAAALAATSAAQLYTLPIILYLQPSLPIYSVAANLLVEWVVAPVTILGMLSVVFSTFFPLLAQLLSFFASLGTEWIVLVANNLSELPFVRTHFPAGVWGIALVTTMAILVTIWLRSKKYSRVGLVALLATLGVTISWISADVLRINSFAGDWEIYACDVGQGDALLVRSGDEIALIDVGPDPELIAHCLKMAGIDSLALLVLTHFDADHVGGIKGLRSVEIKRVLISPFRDSRPLVAEVERELAAKGIRAEHGFRGLTGAIGEIEWLVISPSASASEVSDSNDASLALVFDIDSYALLTLGDLGESGQLRLLKSEQRLFHQLAERPLVIKFAHHGSADQSEDLYRLLKPDLAIFLVGKNRYGHPTNKAIEIVSRLGATVIRTDKQGPLAIGYEGGLVYRVGGKLSA